MLARPQAFVCLAHFEIRPLLSSRSVTTGHLKTYAKFHRPARNSRSQRQHRRRTGLGCIAHAGHNHSHGDTSDVPCQVQETDHSHDDGSPCCSSVIGHSHGNHDDPLNPIHRILTAILNITGASKVVPWLADSVPSSVAKILLFALAAWAAWAAGCAAAASTAQALRQVSALATAGVYFFAGVPAAVDLSYDLSALRVDTHVLMHLAVVGTLVTGLPLEGALLLVLFQTSHAVEHLLTARAQGSLKALYASVPDHADLVSLGPDGAPALDSVRRVLAADVTIGDVMLIKPGGQVPLDGVIVHGRALVSAEHITGESLPSLRRSGDEVPAGALCHDGVLAIKALREARNSTPARIAQLARDAQAQRPQLRTWLDTFGEIYSKAVIVGTAVALCAMLAAGVPFGGAGAERGALYRAMSLLTVASPCALVMVPLAYVSAIAAAASRGVLLKGGRVLDALYGCRVIAVDKTGTLTTGRLALRSCILVAGADGGSSTTARRDALAVAAALSLRSSHPVSDAVVQAGDAEGVNAGAVGVADFVLVPGGGVSGTASLGNRAPDLEAEFGSIDFIAESLTPQERSDVEAYRKQSGANSIMSVLLLKPASSANGNGSGSERSVWALSFADTLQGVSVGAVEALQEGSWAGGGPAVSHRRDVVMLTGDNTASAAQVAGQLGIHKVFAGLSPEEKLQHVASLRAPRRGVMMVGDGLNDAAALAAADVGVAIASPMTAAATLASDAVLMRGAAGIAAVPLLLRIARATRHVIRQNLVLAAGSIVALALPAVLGFIPLWVAVMLHEGSTLLVALNSLRLLRFSAAMQQTSRRAEKDSPAVAEVDAAVMQESLPVPA